LKTLFWKYNDESIFSSIAKTFKYLLSDDKYSLRNDALTTSTEIIRNMISKLKSTVKQLTTEEKENENEKEKLSLEIALLRIKCFLQEIDITSEGIYQDISPLIESRVNNEDISDQSIKILLEISVCDLLWKLMKIDFEKTSEEDFKALRIQKRNLFNHLFSLLDDKIVCFQSFNYIMEVIY
jgi:hypothetical protein